MYRVEEKFCCTAREMYSLQRRLDGVLRADDNEHNDEGSSGEQPVFRRSGGYLPAGCQGRLQQTAQIPDPYL